MERNELQEMDIKILNAIRHEARKPYEQIAKEVGLSRTAVKNRIRAMEESGIILEYETKLQRANSGQACRFILDVETNPRDFESIKNFLGESKFIQELYVAAGSNHLHAVGVVFNQATLQTVINRIQREMCDVHRLWISPLMAVCKDTEHGVEYVHEEEKK